jgi:hypothetical protein
MRTHIQRTFAGVGAAVAMLASLLPSAAGAMTVSPPMYDYSVNKGAVVKDVIKLFNEGKESITLTPSVMNFAAKEEVLGTPDLYPKTEKRNGHELANWITMSEGPVTLAPGQWGNVEFSVNVPKNADPGGYYGAVVFQAGDANVQQGVGLIGGTAVLVVLKVQGDVREDFAITNFESKSSSYSHLPATFSLRVENKGNVHQKPVGNVFIKNFWGKQVFSLPLNSDSKNVLPNSARIFEATWQKEGIAADASEFAKEWSNFAFGPYTASVVLNYGSKGQIATADASFWVLPWLVFFLYMAMLAVLVFLLSLALKRYNVWVVEQYKKGGTKK